MAKIIAIGCDLFNGDAPASRGDYLFSNSAATIYHFAGASGWGETFAGRPVEIWPLDDGGWDVGFQPLGGNWRRLSWFGDYIPMGSDGWIWHNGCDST